MYILETERIIIKEFQEGDVHELMKVFSDPDVMMFSSHGVRNEHQILDFIKHSKQNYKLYNFGQWGLFNRSTGEFLGVAGLNKSDVNDSELVHVSYRLKKSRQGNGYAVEAVNGILKYAKEMLGFSSLHAMIDPNNKPSEKLALKAGFTLKSQCTFKGDNLNLYRIIFKQYDA